MLTNPRQRADLEQQVHSSVSHLLVFSFSHKVPAWANIDPRRRPVEEAETVCVDPLPAMDTDCKRHQGTLVCCSLLPMSPRGHASIGSAHVHLLHREGKNSAIVAIKLESPGNVWSTEEAVPGGSRAGSTGSGSSFCGFMLKGFISFLLYFCLMAVGALCDITRGSDTLDTLRG